MIVGGVIEAKITFGTRHKVVEARTRTKEIRRIVTLIQEETIDEEDLSIEEGQTQEELMDN